MTTIKIAGVPEHFNFPWHLALRNKEFQDIGIDLEWIDVPEGTGKICEMLRSGTADMAVVLTEGIVKDILAGNPSRLIQEYVKSPLTWGIHVSAQSSYQSISDLKNKKAAISRLGSGSQLMAYVNADNQGWEKDNLKFEIVNTIDGAVAALTQGVADYFMWECFMTKPLVDKGVFRKIGDCPTPWPSFVIVARQEILESKPELIQSVLEVINKETAGFKNNEHIDQILATRFNQKQEDIQLWLSLTHWSQESLSEKGLKKIQNQLFELKIIDKIGTFEEIVKIV